MRAASAARKEGEPMTKLRSPARNSKHAALAVLAVVGLTACSGRTETMTRSELTDFATRYAAAWSGQNADELASFYTHDGSLSVNGGEPAVGRAAIAATARGFMDAFPDMVVTMDAVSQEGSRVVFHWTWTGANTGPGGTGRRVRISGSEEWTLAPDGLIQSSDGHYDEAEYQRQVSGDGGRS
jgi:uncharacterized protein (TIGR02246 family)